MSELYMFSDIAAHYLALRPEAMSMSDWVTRLALVTEAVSSGTAVWYLKREGKKSKWMPGMITGTGTHDRRKVYDVLVFDDMAAYWGFEDEVLPFTSEVPALPLS